MTVAVTVVRRNLARISGVRQALSSHDSVAATKNFQNAQGEFGNKPLQIKSDLKLHNYATLLNRHPSLILSSSRWDRICSNDKQPRSA